MANPADTPDPNVEVQTPSEQAQNPTEDMAAKLAAAEAEAVRLAAERDELSADAQAWRDKQDADKTELERLAETSAKQKADLAAAQLENARLVAANKYGISEENLDLLDGASAEELEARAQKLADLQKKSQVTAPPSQTPTENLTPGGGDNPPVEDNAFPSNWIV